MNYHNLCQLILNDYSQSISSNNPNKNKILTCLEWWLSDFTFFYKNFILKKNYKVENLKNINIHHFLSKNEIKSEVILKRDSNYLKVFFLNLFSNIFLNNNIYLTISKSLIGKINYFFSGFLLKNIINNKDFNIETKRNFIKLISKYSDKDKKFINSISYLFPDVFFSKSISPYKEKEYNIICSPILFISNIYFIKVFFSKKKVNVLGFQHGSIYGFFKKNKIENFEKKISDKFFYWNKNFPITRFEYNKFPKFQNLNSIKYLVLGEPKISNYLADSIDGINNFYSNNEVINKICSFLKKNKLDYGFIKYPNTEYNLEHINLIKLKYKIENYIDSNFHVLVFTNPLSTLIFYALKNNIPFVIISPNLIEKKLTNYFYKFLKNLTSLKIFFLEDEINNFYEEILNLNICENYKAKKNALAQKFNYQNLNINEYVFK